LLSSYDLQFGKRKISDCPKSGQVEIRPTGPVATPLLVGSVKHIFSTGVHIDHSWSSKVIDSGTNRKYACNFLLVHHSNLGPISPFQIY